MAIDFNKLLAETRAKAQQQVTTPPVSSDGRASSASPLPAVAPQSTTQVEKVAGSIPAQVAPISAEPSPAIEYPGLVDLKERINSLGQALLAKHPAMDSLLQTIHRNLQKDPELVHMLKPEDTALIFKALQQKTQTQIVTEAVKSASSGKGRGLKNLGLEDL